MENTGTQKAFTTKEAVKFFLTNFKDARDSDPLLQSKIWEYERQKKKIPKEEFLMYYAMGKFTLAETIRRNRQSLQKDNPELRGERYDERKRKLEPEWREEFGPKK